MKADPSITKLKINKEKDKDQLIRLIDLEVASLPDELHEPIFAYLLEGASLDETAKKLDMSPKSLKITLERGMSLLLAKLRVKGFVLSSDELKGMFTKIEAPSEDLIQKTVSRVLTARMGAPTKKETASLQIIKRMLKHIKYQEASWLFVVCFGLVGSIGYFSSTTKFCSRPDFRIHSHVAHENFTAVISSEVTR